jgi:hypothetical protein
MDRQRPRVPRAVVALAVAVGIAAGSYGIANAASGSGSGSSSGSPSSSSYAAQAIAASPAAPGAQGSPWGGQRLDETLLTGDAKAGVEKAAVAKVPNGTIVRVETDADGNALYEAHMTEADGTPVTVYVDKSFGVVGVETR